MEDDTTEEIFPVRINGKLICTCGSCHSESIHNGGNA